MMIGVYPYNAADGAYAATAPTIEITVYKNEWATEAPYEFAP